MDIAKFLQTFENQNKYSGNSSKFFNFKKAGAGAYRFRPYRFTVDGQKTLFCPRMIHFQGRGKPPIDFGTPESKEIMAKIDHLKAAGDTDSMKKAEALAPVAQFSMVFILESEPDGFRIIDMSQSLSRRTLVAIANVGGWVGDFPYSDSASPEDVAKFGEALDTGMEKVCGPEGMDVTYVYSTKPKVKYEVQINPFVKSAVLDFPEDDDVPNPEEVRQRIAEAMAKKNDG